MSEGSEIRRRQPAGLAQADAEPLSGDEAWAHWDAMRRSAFKVLGQRDEARECAAEALAEILERPPLGVRNAEAFLVTVAKRRAIDHLRATTSARRRLLRFGRAQLVTDADVAEAVADQQEAAWIDAQARASLPPASYRLLQMLADGVDLETAARALSMTTRAAESRLLRARRTMGAVLAKTLGLGGLLTGLRRLLASAAPTAVVAGLAVLVLVLPSVDGPGARETPVHAVPDPTSRSIAPPPEAPRAALAAPRGDSTSTTPTAWPIGQAQPVASARPQIRTPVGSVRQFDMDDGYHSTGPVDSLKHCLQNLSVSLHHQGCEAQPTP